MSGAPKRLHEDGSHPTISKRPFEDFILYKQLARKLTPVTSEYHQPFEHGHDGRFGKVQRTDERRSSLPPIYQMHSSSDLYLDHLVASENRAELKDSMENLGATIENRGMKAGMREMYTEPRIDSQSSEGETYITRSESRGDDKEIRFYKESNTDLKGETNIEKDGYGAGNSHLNGSQTKEHYRGKRCSESPSDGVNSWRYACSNLESMNTIGREASATEERECLEAHETVGDNMVDLRSEVTVKEKDREKKDEKHRDWEDRDMDQNDRRNKFHVHTSTEHHESVREDREMDRLDREKKDVTKDKEGLKEKEKDNIKREISIVNEKESLRNEKELADRSVKTAEQESPSLEEKRLKEFESWKAVNWDVKDRKRERDLDAEGDQHEKRGMLNDKESGDGCTEGDLIAERDREVFGCGVQQRRRRLRPRGNPQVANVEPHLRCHAQDSEGSQGYPKVSTVVYKAGECMQELTKLWKEFETSEDNKNGECSHNGSTLEIHIPAEYITATNHQVRGGQLWGTDVYTDDSDLVAVLMHTGYCHPTASPPPPAIHELCATIRVLPPQDCYTSTLRNNVRSRAWGAGIGCSYCVEQCCIVKKGGGTIDLDPRLSHTLTVEPTLAPVAVERTMTTRAAASNALRQQRFVREITIQYNLCNEPWVKYSISMVTDKGLKKPLYTSARLKKGEVLYLETHSNRYELCFSREKAVTSGKMTTSHAAESESEKLLNHNSHATQISNRNQTDSNNIIDAFRWSRCKKVLPQKVMHSIGIPLPDEHVEVLEDNLDWEDVQWSQNGVWIAGKEYVLARVHFLLQQ